MRALLFGGVCISLLGWGLACSGVPSEEPESRSVRQELGRIVEVGPEIGTEPPVAVQYDTGHSPDVASDGAGYLAVFEDLTKIRAVRVTASGSPTDVPWLDLGEANVEQYSPNVAYGSGRYLVVWWQSDANDVITVRGRMILPDGSVEGNASFVIGSGEGLDPAVAWNGQNFVVSWLGLAGEGVNDIRVALVAPGGSVVAGSERAVSTSGQTSRPRLAATNAGTLVAWEDRGGGTSAVRATLVASNGSVATAGGVRVSDSTLAEREVEVATSGSTFLVTWHRDAEPHGIRGSIVSTAGAVTQRDFAISRNTGRVGLPSAAFDGTHYLVSWLDERDERSVYGARVSPAGVIVGSVDVKLADGMPRSISGSDGTSLAWSGSRYLLAFLGNGIEGSLITPALTLEDGSIPLSAVASKQGTPRVVWTGQHYVLGWTDERDPDPVPIQMTARATRLGPTGNVLDPSAIALSEPRFAFDLSLASAGDGSSLVCWLDTANGGWQRSISATGELGAVSSVTTTPLSWSPQMATNGANYLRVHGVTPSGPTSTQMLVGQLLASDGTASPAFTVESGVLLDVPSVMAVGTDYLVSYRSTEGARLVPVSSSGNVGATLPLSSDAAHVRAAHSSTNALLVWTEFNDPRVRARLFTSGTFGGVELDISPTSAGFGAAAVWDGNTYWVVWESPEPSQLFARSVDTDGAMSAPVLLVEDEALSPTLASDGEGRFVVSYFRFGERARTRRIVSHLVTTSSAPPIDPGTGGSAGDSAGSGGAAPSGGSGNAGRGGTGTAGSSAGRSSNAGSSGSAGTDAGNAGDAGDGGGGGRSQCAVSAAGAERGSTGFLLAFATLWLAAARRKRAAASRTATRA